MLSPDGTKVVFESRASNLGDTDTGGPSGIFERHLATGVTTRLADGLSGSYSPSADAVAFFDSGHVWLRASATGAVTQVSTGTKVAFVSTGSGRGGAGPGWTRT